MCAPFLEQLPVAGVSISVVSRGGAQSTVGTSDLIASRLEELQFQLGEGPSVDVLASGRLLLVDDLADGVLSAGWPVFAPAAVATGARALFTLPLSMSAATVPDQRSRLAKARGSVVRKLIHQAGRGSALSTVFGVRAGGIEKPFFTSRRRAPPTGVSTVTMRVS